MSVGFSMMSVSPFLSVTFFLSRVTLLTIHLSVLSDLQIFFSRLLIQLTESDRSRNRKSLKNQNINTRFRKALLCVCIRLALYFLYRQQNHSEIYCKVKLMTENS